MWPLSIVRRIGHGHWKVKRGDYVDYSKGALVAVNGETDSSGIALPSGCHGLVEVNHYSWIEELARSHKWLKRVEMNNANRVPELR